MSLLEVTGLEAGYGSAQVLFGVNLSVGAGQVSTLLGRNGMGKTTTIRAIMGLLKPKAGTIKFNNIDMTGAAPYEMGRSGIGLVPEGRQIFPTLNVEENLLAMARKGGRWGLAEVYRFFPGLKERKTNMGNQLSGGEQQMLAIGRALMTNPNLLILDEATEGLAPLIRDEIWNKLTWLKQEGEAILVIDKNVDALTKLAAHHTVLEKGQVVWSGTANDLAGDPKGIRHYLHL